MILQFDRRRGSAEILDETDQPVPDMEDRMVPTNTAGSGRWRHPPVLTADEAVLLIESGDRVYLHEVAMTPHELLDALVRRARGLSNIEVVSLHTEGPAP